MREDSGILTEGKETPRCVPTSTLPRTQKIPFRGAKSTGNTQNQYVQCPQASLQGISGEKAYTFC